MVTLTDQRPLIIAFKAPESERSITTRTIPWYTLLKGYSGRSTVSYKQAQVWPWIFDANYSGISIMKFHLSVTLVNISAFNAGYAITVSYMK